MPVIMNLTRRQAVTLPFAAAAAAQPAAAPVHYVRFQAAGRTAYGRLEGDTIHELAGPLLGARKPTGATHPLASVKLLAPCQPSKVLAVGLNYKSHIGNTSAPKRPEIFYKPITCLQNPGDPIVIPAGANNVHYEGEMVVVIGTRAKNLSRDQAAQAIFGYTCGNDVSERDWQNGPDKDMQWWRAKGADTFGPVGPAIVTGLDIARQRLQTRLNGEVKQEAPISDLLFDPPAIVAWISRYVTLIPGDIIFTGTPGHTSPMKPGDSVEVEISGIGILKNPLRAGS
jgi:2-keto-4-pentenoate hydratase/2-oxohepta-3-ene-1,7-dioic acid hydratase in catechol pathway